MIDRPSPFTYTPTRTTQPYRNGVPRPPGMALAAMLNGRTLYGQNPADQQRQAQSGFPNPGVREGSLWWHMLSLPKSGLQFRVK